MQRCAKILSKNLLDCYVQSLMKMFFHSLSKFGIMNPDINPSRTFKDKLEVNLAGLDLVLYHAPGETNDQIIVHWPAQNVVFPADNLYRAFPNLYAIRGTMSR